MVESYCHFLSLLLLISPAASLGRLRSAEQPLCSRSDHVFLIHHGSQCPSSVNKSLPVEVSGEILEKVLGSHKISTYFSVLFYASWCPFSLGSQPTFDALSSMFPQIKHFLVEESSVMPSLLSRYGIHSFPAIILINGTARLHYHGSKDLTSLVYFYKKSTGFDSVIHLEIDQAGSGNVRTQTLQVETTKELITKEPYFAFSVLFIFLRMIICFVPAIYSHVKVFWVSHAWHLTLRFLCELSHLSEQVLHLVDVRKLWSNLRIRNRTRNLRKGANNARVWATNLASVSLGESSTSKLILTDPQ
ncbi:5'-adenylylsulfate reductase-like 5 [Zingiber officinale]|uniref:5'-adenylylsulfate reductase-like 5 n=1 Tax=Zingiber officinale TaxID=94328 RepID=UPI001C4ADBEA|nr:5'-adenylylsulfate reductase-like 5 [Zingiber officinale]